MLSASISITQMTQRFSRPLGTHALAALLLLLGDNSLRAAEPAPEKPAAEAPAAEKPAAQPPAGGDRKIEMAGGKLKMTAPANWQRKKPQNQIIEHEFAVPPAEDDSEDGRVTIMGAGGSVDANIERWVGQFTQPDGSATKAKTSKLKVGDDEVHIVDISGTFNDTRGPFSGTPAVERKKYRMLSAIVTTKKFGNYFVKFAGPQRTVAENEKAFEAMLQGLETK